MERSVRRLDQSHGEMCFTMQGTGERDEWMRVFPDPMPATHELAYRWEGMKLYVGPRAVGEKQKEPPPAPLDDGLRRELEKLPEKDLITRAAEKGVKVNKGMSKAQLVAAVLGK